MIKLYDTRRRQKVDFEPVEPGKVSMYVCGPTVYNRIHIGNARTFISFDMIRRYLTWRGFDVTFVQNVTDVDDKIIKRAGEEARTAAEVAEADSSPPTPFRSSETPESASAMEAACSASEASPGATFAS